MELVDQNQNATPTYSGWLVTPEALYLDALSASGTGSTPVLNLNGLSAYVYNGGSPVALTNGMHNGVMIVGGPVPEPSALVLLGSLGLGLALGWWRKRRTQA